MKTTVLLAFVLFAVSQTASSTTISEGAGTGAVANGPAYFQPSTGVTVLTFEGVGDQQSIGNFYNGGPGGNLGISFSQNSLGIIEDEAGGSGNFANEPSPVTVAFFLSGGADTMNVAGGFTTGFSFFYAADIFPGTVTVWSGLNGTGTELASINLPTNPASSCPVDPGSGYCNWTNIGVSFSGTAESVNFGGTANYIGFDDVTLGSAVAGTPEPGTFVLLGAGLLGTVMIARRRKRSA